MIRPSDLHVLDDLEPPRWPIRLELRSGDVLTLDVTAGGAVLVTLDDVDDTEMPTAALSRLEAIQLVGVLVIAAEEIAGR